MKFIAHWFFSSLAVFIVSALLPGVAVASFKIALLVALVLGFLNAIIRPILLVVTLPLNILTLGLFTFVINASMVLLASNLVDGFKVRGFWWALLFSLIYSPVNSLFHHLEKEEK